MAITEYSTFRKRLFERPERVLAGTFAGLILIGAVLLSLPVMHGKDGVSVLDALFTATSAVCVTGLVVVDTGTDFSLAGQIVILALIQLGGLGIMTFAALVLQVAGRKLSFRSQAALHDVFYQHTAAARFRQNLKWIVLLSLAIEACGALLLFWAMPDRMNRGQAAYVAVFHAVSAFCNAGFSTFSDSLVSLRDEAGFMTVMSLLIITGGLGYTVLFELIGRAWRRITLRSRSIVWTLNTRLVLVASLILIIGGAAATHAAGRADRQAGRILHAAEALFQSISARTAGFNTVDIGSLPLASLLCLVLLMFIGGAPGSCAGGIKTTSASIWAARLRARLRRHEDVTLGGRRIPVDLVRRTGLLLGVSVLYNLVGIMVLAITESGRPDVGLEDFVFEQVSAFATCGLSTGITAGLTSLGKLWIIFTMFVGRLGPLTIALVIVEQRPATVRLAEERLMIG